MKALAPWGVGGILLVSFTANAGPRVDAFDAPARRMWTLGGGATVLKLPVPRQAGPVGADEKIGEEPAEKAPSVPTGAREGDFRDALLFSFDPTLWPTERFQPRDDLGDQLVFVTGRFAQDLVIDNSRTLPLRGTTALESAPPLSPTELVELTAATPDGATPGIRRTMAAASITPPPPGHETGFLPPLRAQQDASSATTPLTASHVEIADTPNYADLIDPENMSREQRCLAEAVYFEARSEPPAGQAAVAQVVLNRVGSGLYPDSVCGVVYQNRNRYLGCQFSFACEGKSLRVTEQAAWRQAVRIAREVTFGRTYVQAVGNATHYHAKYVKPTWSRVFARKDSIGQHVFYRPKPGQG